MLVLGGENKGCHGKKHGYFVMDGTCKYMPSLADCWSKTNIGILELNVTKTILHEKL